MPLSRGIWCCAPVVLASLGHRFMWSARLRPCCVPSPGIGRLLLSPCCTNSCTMQTATPSHSPPFFVLWNWGFAALRRHTQQEDSKFFKSWASNQIWKKSVSLLNNCGAPSAAELVPIVARFVSHQTKVCYRWIVYPTKRFCAGAELMSQSWRS